jgi:hypothetical protein
MEMFEQASREKTRFSFKGWISVEDLWDLTVEELDSIFKGLNAKLRTTKENSLLGAKNAVDDGIEFQVAIIKHIVEVKQAETAMRLVELENRRKKQKILGILSKKQDMDLEGKSIEDLNKMLEDL